MVSNTRSFYVLSIVQYCVKDNANFSRSLPFVGGGGGGGGAGGRLSSRPLTRKQTLSFLSVLSLRNIKGRPLA